MFLSVGGAIAEPMRGFKYYSEDYAPYNFIQGQIIKGLAIDLLAETTKQIGGQVDQSAIAFLPWPRACYIVKNYPNTVLLSTARIESREDTFKWGGPIGSTRIVVLAKKQSNINIEKFNDLTDYVIGVVREDISAHLLAEKAIPGLKMEYAKTAKPLVKMLNLGRIDLWAYEENVARMAIKSAGFINEEFEVVYTLKELELYYAFNHQTDNNLLSLMQKHLDELTSKPDGKKTPYYNGLLSKYGLRASHK